jgi:hypothetical protein
LADPGLQIAAVAQHAGVGISALYRRYPSNKELLRRFNRDSPADYIADIETVLAECGDPWSSSTHRPPTRSVSQQAVPPRSGCNRLGSERQDLTARCGSVIVPGQR